MNLTKEQKQIGKDNFNDVVGHSRRDFLKGAVAGGAGLGAVYFGYKKLEGDRVKVAFIGTGDEGSVLLNEHPIDYMEITAIADMRPSNRERAKTGDPDPKDGSPNPRRGLNKILGKDTASQIKEYDSHKALLDAREKGEVLFDAVVIAVPLIQHAQVAMDCLDKGVHVLTEKLMARTIGQCKEMITKAKDKKLLLAVGHQRHYNVLYDNANDIVQRGLLGDIKHIRALWHRNNSFPGRDSWQKQTGSDGIAYASDKKAMQEQTIQDLGYPSFEKLANWRLYKDTGGGLMAELGSHQLDAASIFLGKVHPIAVTGFGGKNFYGVNWKDENGNLTGIGPEDKWDDQREIDDHVYVIFEFPGPNYKKNPLDVVIVTYSSISTNASEPYGEYVYGSRGTLIMLTEQETLLAKEGSGFSTRVTVQDEKDGKKSIVETSDSVGPSVAITANTTGPKVSRGYTEEMEHFCYAVKNKDDFMDGEGNMKKPDEGGLRCPGFQGMADAIMALTANIAMEKRQRIEFNEDWFKAEKFDPENPNKFTPEGDLLST
jgi:predicted dehydrogenase